MTTFMLLLTIGSQCLNPEFYPTQENDIWWGKGFTEWTNVGRAQPLFRGHYQPKVPADLNYYDLRLPIVRSQQANLAHEAGIEGFFIGTTGLTGEDYWIRFLKK